MREKIFDIVMTTIKEFNTAYDQHISVELGEEASLYGKNGVLDSLGLVSLIVMIEQAIEDELELSIILADEKAMSQNTSPFLKIGFLVNYINKVIEEEMSVWKNR